MESKELMEAIIASVAVGGGLIFAAIVTSIGIREEMKKQLAKMEARSKERLALIEKGLDPQLADQPDRASSYNPLLWGLLLVGVALGAATGYLISLSGANEFIVINITAMLFGGISLLIYYRIMDGKKNG